MPRVYPSRYQTFIGHLSDISDTLKAEDVRYLALRELSGSSRIETPQNPRSLAVLKLRSYRNVATRKRFAFSRTPPAFAPTVLTLRTSVRRALAGHASFTSPLPPIPLPHHPRITPSHLTVLMLRFFAPSVLTLLPFGQSRFEPSHLTHLHLRLPRPIHRLLLPADIAPADLHLHPRKLPVIEDPRQGLHLRRPLCLLEAVVAEVDPSAAFDRRCRPAAADVAGLVLRRREGDIVCGVDRGGWLHVYTRFHIFTPGLTPRKST